MLDTTPVDWRSVKIGYNLWGGSASAALPNPR